jgi:hypothetical protein
MEADHISLCHQMFHINVLNPVFIGKFWILIGVMGQNSHIKGV